MNYKNILTSINKDNNYLVVPNKIKAKIIQIKTDLEITNKKLFKFKVITMDELISNLSFNIDSEAYLYNLDKFNRPVSITKELFLFAKYNLDKKNEVLNNFIDQNKDFVIKNNSFKSNINKYHFHILGNNVYLKYYIDLFKLNVSYISITEVKKPKVHKFITKEEEVFYLFEQISHLLYKGTNINNIYLANVDKTYESLISKLASFYKIPVNLELKESLLNIPYVNKLLSNNYNTIINLLSNKTLINEMFKYERAIDEIAFDENINRVINVFNNYPHQKYNADNVMKIIKEDIKNTNVKSNINFDNAIKVIKTEEILTLSNDEHVFIVNSVYESFPKIAKDNDIISNEDKEKLGYPTSSEININNNNYYKKIIMQPNIKYLSYSLRDNTNEYTPSDITASLIANDQSPTKITLSTIDNGYATKYYKTYFSNKNNKHLQTTFTGKFKLKKTEKKELINALNKQKIKMSPSQITTYFQLPFIFYLERVLGFNTFEKNINVNIGNFFHSLIEVMLLLLYEEKVDRRGLTAKRTFSYDENTHQKIFDYIIKKGNNITSDFDFGLFFDEYLEVFFHQEIKEIETNSNEQSNKENATNIKTLFYTKKHKEKIIEALMFIVDLEEELPSNSLLIEKKVELSNLKGSADLVKVYNDNTYSIIDYKTGARAAFNKNNLMELVELLLEEDNQEIDLKTLTLLQLIFYAYFFYRSNPNLKLKDLSYFSYLENSLSLNGITTKASFDSNHYKRNIAGRRQIGEDELNRLFNNIEQLLAKTFKNINDFVFPITIRRDSKTKEGMDKKYYSIYEALAFFNDNNEEGDFNNE